MSPDPRSRFAWLLDIKPEWELEEIWSLVKDVAPDNVKRESYIMKFARKRKVGRKVMISKDSLRWFQCLFFSSCGFQRLYQFLVIYIR